MPNTDRTARILTEAARYLNDNGLHTGDQFATNDPWPRLDVCAAIYWAATNTLPNVFRTDEGQSIDLIRASRWAMDAVRALSAALDTEPGTDLDTDEPDHVAHVSNWAATTPICGDRPPTETEVIGRLRRTADALRDTTGHQAAA